MAKIELNIVASGYYDTTRLNANFTAIEAAFEKVLFLDGTLPNSLLSNLDANSYRIINVSDPVNNQDVATKKYIDDNYSPAAVAAAQALVDQVAVSLLTSSTTSNSIGTGNKTFTVEANKQFQAGQPIIVVNTANSTRYMYGTVVSYTGTTLVINSTKTGSSGTYASWNISVAGIPGVDGMGSGDMLKSDNLSGLGDYAVARTNLGLGSAAVLNAGTAANNVVQLNVAGQLPAVDGSQLTGIATVDPNAMLSSLTLQKLNNSTFQRLIGGFADGYATATGVDLTTSTGETYNPGSKSFTSGSSGSAAYNGTSGVVALDTFSAVGAGSGNTWRTVIPSSQILMNGSRIQLRLGANASAITLQQVWIAEAAASGDPYDYTGSPVQLFFGGNPSASIAANGEVLSDSTTFTISTLKSYVILVLMGTGNPGYTSAKTQILGYYKTGNDIATANATGYTTAPYNCPFFKELVTSTNSNMSLVSNAITPASTVSSARILVLAKPNVAITLNTDLIASISRNNGSNYAPVTLVDMGFYDSTNTIKMYLSNYVSLTGQASPSNVKYKIDTANLKDIELCGAGLLWS